MLSSNHLPSSAALLQAFSTSPKLGCIHVGKGAKKDKQETLKTNTGHCESLRYKTQPPGSCFALFSASLCRVEEFSVNRDGGTMCFASSSQIGDLAAWLVLWLLHQLPLNQPPA